ncbi:unnamed protein product [Rotaria sordida]|uniref:Uncharacterized protein n=1 Tax=Rotaria sordida TaxID=392033 RepID=A0A815GUN6_9BILA|nr:unnamed protein product [Rotaria sordida]CAF1597957.1 unnamed protein product [Rotaria sordida]
MHMVQSVVPSASPLILSVYESNNKFTTTDISKRWLYIYNQGFIQGIRVIGFSSDGDPRYLRTMRLYIRFFAELPNLNLFKHNDNFACENTFHVFRALSGPYSSITNCTVKSFIKRYEKISIINAIKSREGQINDYNFKFLQHHKNDEEIYNYSTNPIKQLNLTESDIEKIIENAFESAKKYATMVNMIRLLINKNTYTLPELSQFIKINISKSSSKVVDYTEGINLDEDSDEDELQGEPNDSEVVDDKDQLSTNNTDEE